ncbi:NAD(P)-dependent oxidoreductase [Nocardioides sp. cx-173]|uniref:NAD-dependent epimerase/dehydratase family protein n=1 Tax=Nocardioides sp. cx-173 TaxID=2898796 RepID=UPI001E55070C|nr:NAD-dependent epimerase/dehydratase family protein [Nocardioides sp. cx-173]MCD4526399.1 NAD-dependent epimerase/dehydratase family protein [Nocardioides sp. cx-173]UGB43570.1 NAD-dependent epimerase/dehydratase family protein [Nocardioides sp. cx-173]
MSQVALVTGGSGYFGSLLVDQLLRAGLEVRVLDIIDAPDRPSDVQLFHGDVRDEHLVGAAVRGADLVFHNVAQVPLARDRDLFESVNVRGTEVVLRQCEQAAVAKVVHTSSSAVFGVPERNPVTRETVPSPVEAYGRAKLDAELLCRAAVTRGLDVTVVRPRTILGHGRLGIFGILFDWIADGAGVPILGDGTNVYQFVHAEDLASACLLAARRPGAAVYNIGAQEFGTMGEAVGHLCQYAGTGARVRHLPVGPTSKAMEWSARLGLTPFAPYHWIMYSRSLWFDVSPAVEELGWRAQWSTDAMFQSSYDWFLEHRGEESGGSAHRRSAKQGLLRLAKQVL